jgi:hypothetical protein
MLVLFETAVIGAAEHLRLLKLEPLLRHWQLSTSRVQLKLSTS